MNHDLVTPVIIGAISGSIGVLMAGWLIRYKNGKIGEGRKIVFSSGVILSGATTFTSPFSGPSPVSFYLAQCEARRIGAPATSEKTDAPQK
jgi:hypothetical protein